jgi:hypothetical protein
MALLNSGSTGPKMGGEASVLSGRDGVTKAPVTTPNDVVGNYDSAFVDRQFVNPKPATELPWFFKPDPPKPPSIGALTPRTRKATPNRGREFSVLTPRR